MNDLCIFGQTNWRDQRKKFGIRRADRRYHLHLIGKTGVGKSTLLEHLIASDLRDGHGLAVLDPHGDLVKSVLRHVPKERADDLLYFDPTNVRSAIPFNILKDHYAHRYLIASGILSAMKKVWGDSWGPRMEHILRYTLLALLAYPDATLIDVPRILLEKAFRQRVLCYVEDTQVRAFFEDEFAKYASRFQNEAVSPILNKVGGFLANPSLRHLFQQKENRLQFRPIMDGRKVFLANLAKGSLGEDSSSLLGALILSQIELATLSRADVREEQRRPFYLYVDEFQNFATTSFAGMLSEARKYGLSITLSHQTLGQLDDDVRHAVFGNVGTLICFQVGAEDAEYLEKEFQPTFRREDLTNLSRHQFYVKMMVNGVVSEPFSATTLTPQPG
ncbi:MAG: type IV secretion system DNA-binding domain-containing protein [Candidatus Poribacteria bacterium]|nr:type IV secretion system DNA-binding domain-containing protein [Candidatus Poribacteria bacterium]